MIVTVVFAPLQQNVNVPTSTSVTDARAPGSRNAGRTVPAMGSMCGVVSLLTNVMVDPRGTVTVFNGNPVVRKAPPVTMTTVTLEGPRDSPLAAVGMWL